MCRDAVAQSKVRGGASARLCIESCWQMAASKALGGTPVSLNIGRLLKGTAGPGGASRRGYHRGLGNRLHRTAEAAPSHLEVVLDAVQSTDWCRGLDTSGGVTSRASCLSASGLRRFGTRLSTISTDELTLQRPTVEGSCGHGALVVWAEKCCPHDPPGGPTRRSPS